MLAQEPMIDLSRVELHEGAHVVAAITQGLGLKSARILPSGLVLTDYSLNLIPGMCRDERVVFLIAGHVAEVIFDPEGADIQNSFDDYDRALQLLDGEDYPSIQEVAAKIAPFIDKAIALVLAHRPEIEAVARVLLREPCKTLSGAEIRRALG
jgi:hypothetical protein